MTTGSPSIGCDLHPDVAGRVERAVAPVAAAGMRLPAGCRNAIGRGARASRAARHAPPPRSARRAARGRNSSRSAAQSASAFASVHEACRGWPAMRHRRWPRRRRQGRPRPLPGRWPVQDRRRGHVRQAPSAPQRSPAPRRGPGYGVVAGRRARRHGFVADLLGLRTIGDTGRALSSHGGRARWAGAGVAGTCSERRHGTRATTGNRV